MTKASHRSLITLGQFSQRNYPVPLEAVHKLVRHDTVRTKQLRTVKASSDCSNVATLACSARSRLVNRSLQKSMERVIRDQQGWRCWRHVLTSRARYAISAVVELFQATQTKYVKAGKYSGQHKRFVANCAHCSKRRISLTNRSYGKFDNVYASRDANTRPNLPLEDAGGEFSRDRAGSESMSDPRGVPDRDSREGVGDPTDIFKRDH